MASHDSPAPKQSWSLGMERLPLLEAQHRNETHQALERAVPYFIQYVEPPHSADQLNTLMGVLRRWHTQGLATNPPQLSPTPGWLLLQAALMEHTDDWLDVLLKQQDMIDELSLSNAMSHVATFAAANDIPLRADVIGALWRATVRQPTPQEQSAADSHLVRLAQWFAGAGMTEDALDRDTLERVAETARVAGFAGQLKGVREDNLMVTALKRYVLERQADAAGVERGPTPRHRHGL